MQHELIVDVPSPIDLRKTSDAVEWAKTAMEKRPWRSEFFARFAAIVGEVPNAAVLELGSGPGYLAEHILHAVPTVKYALLDFSEAMHDLARSRLQSLPPVRYITANFKDPGWSAELGPFDFVVTMQAIHELRHKSYATALHAQVRAILKPGGAYLACDHYCGDDGMKNGHLYMTIAEQRVALEAAGFRVREVLRLGGLTMHHAA